MHADDEKMLLENIEEFVIDEGKLVTYKWLSAALDIHVNTAKQLLYKYVMPNNERKAGVHMTYLLGGVLREGCGIKIQIVRENDLDKAKSKFKLLTSEHIYSVQRLDPLSDLNILYGIDNFKSEKTYEEKFGTVMYKNAIRRSPDQSTPLESNVQSTKVENKVSGLGLGISKVKKEPKPASRLDVDPVVTEQSPLSLCGDTIIADGIAESSKSVSSKCRSDGAAVLKKAGKSTKSNSAVEKSTTKVAKSGIAMLFMKQSEKQSKLGKTAQCDNVDNVVHAMNEENTVCTKEAQPAEIPTAISSKQSSPIKETSKTNMKKDVLSQDNTKQALNQKEKTGKIHNRKSNITTNRPKQQSSLSRKGKKMEQTQPVKKHKRIMIMSDDSSNSDDDIFGNDSDMELKPLSPETEPRPNSSDEDIIPPTPVVQKDVHSGRIRKRKLVDQTFEDKDGFIITKKEYVYESCSEDEGDQKLSKDLVPVSDSLNDNTQESDKNNDVNNKKISKKQTKTEQPLKKKKSLPVEPKTKQSNIMNFFTKS